MQFSIVKISQTTYALKFKNDNDVDFTFYNFDEGYVPPTTPSELFNIAVAKIKALYLVSADTQFSLDQPPQ